MQSSVDSSLGHLPPMERCDEHDDPNVRNTTPLTLHKLSVTPITHPSDIPPTHEGVTSPSQLNCSSISSGAYSNGADVWHQQHSLPLSAPSSLLAPGTPVAYRMSEGDAPQQPTPTLPLLTQRLWKQTPVRELSSPTCQNKSPSAVELEGRTAAHLSMAGGVGNGNTTNQPPSMLFSVSRQRSEIPAATCLAVSPPAPLLSVPLSRRQQECTAKESPVSRTQLRPHTPLSPPTPPATDLPSLDDGERMWNACRLQDEWFPRHKMDGLTPVPSLAPARAHKHGATSRTHTPAASGNCASWSPGRESGGHTGHVARSRSVAATATPLRGTDIVFNPLSKTPSAPSNERLPHSYTVSSTKPLSSVRMSDPRRADYSAPLHASGPAYHFSSSQESTPVRYKKPFVLDHGAARIIGEAAKSSGHCVQSPQRLSRRRYNASTTTAHGEDHIHNTSATSEKPRVSPELPRRPPELWSSDSTDDRLGSASLVNTTHRGSSCSSSSYTADRHSWSTPSTLPPTVIGITSREELPHRLDGAATRSPSTLLHKPQQQQQQPLSMSPRTITPMANIMRDHATHPLSTLEPTPTVIPQSPEKGKSEEMLVSPRCCTLSPFVVKEQEQSSLAPRMRHSTKHSTPGTEERGSLGNRTSLRGSPANTFIPTVRSSSSSDWSRRTSYSPSAPAHTNLELSMPRKLTMLPPPLPWSPREALHWIRNRLSVREQEEILTYDLVYYWGVNDSSTPPPPTHRAEEEVASISSLPTNGEETVSLAAPSSSSSYFPITPGMHIGFRYEVREVLGFGTFSVVVSAVDHAASPFSAERHCALKLIRLEVLYQNAAKAEWAIFEQLKECCAAVSPSCASGSEEGASSTPADHLIKASLHCNSSVGVRPTLPQLSTTDQRLLYTASVLTPRSRFEYRGYHVMVFPLLGFSVRDVMELRCELKEANAHPAVSALSSTPPADASPAQAGNRAAATLPTEVITSLLAQLVRALHFMHHCAHIVHGDIKPENLVFVDRSVTRDNSLSTSGHPAECSEAVNSQPPHHPPSLPPQLPPRYQTSFSWTGTADAFATPPNSNQSPRQSLGVTSLLRPNTAAHHPPLSLSTAATRRPNAFECVERRTTTEGGGGGGRSASSSISTSSSAMPWLMAMRPPPRDNESAGGPDRGVTTGCCSQNLQHPGNKLVSSSQRHPSGGDLIDQCATSGALASLAGRSLCMTGSRTGALSTSPLSTPTDAGPIEGPEGGEAIDTGFGEAPPHGGGGGRGGSATLAGRSGQDSRSGACGGGGGEANSAVTSSIRLRLTYSLPYVMATSTATMTSSRSALIDFGHAHTIPPGTTGSAFPLQSPSYRCPEMALRLPYTTAIDMWSVGCVLYELRVGHALFPNTCDDTTMLQSAVQVLGMPDAFFLATVKSCWKKYKQHKASTVETAARVQNQAAAPSTSSKSLQMSMDPPQLHKPRLAEGSEDAEQNDETLAVERCWRQFIHVLNNAAGHRREHDRRLEGQNQSSTSSVTERSPQCQRGAASHLANSGGGTTTWETPEQLALLQVMFPDGHVHKLDKSFSLTNNSDREQFAWVDFLLGCLYWDAEERLTATEARVHPYLASNFTPDPTAANTVTANVSAASSVTDKMGAAEDAATSASGPLASTSRGVSVGEEPATIRTTHCSGLHYLSCHPFTSRLFQPAPETTSCPLSSQHGTCFTASDNAGLLLAPLRMLPSAIVPFKLPSSKRTAPSARLWEEREQQQEVKTIHLQRVLCYDSAIDFDSTLQTPAGRLSLSPHYSPHHRPNPFDDDDDDRESYPVLLFSKGDQQSVSNIVSCTNSPVYDTLSETQIPLSNGEEP